MSGLNGPRRRDVAAGKVRPRRPTAGGLSTWGRGYGARVPSIADYALLGDCHGAALVSASGSIDWWCPERFDSPSVFSRLLDDSAGHWSLRPSGEFDVSRRYVEGTLVVETEFSLGGGGRLVVTDSLVLGFGERGHDIGYRSPHVLVRKAQAVDGTVDVEMELVGRFEYGLVTPTVTDTATGAELRGGAERLTLTTQRRIARHDDGTLGAQFRLHEGESTYFTLRHDNGVADRSAPVDGAALLSDTIAGWQSWTAMHQSYDGPYREHVERSGLILQALTYRPTGAVVAAPTTSLPEKLGADLNWDYRFGWLRDGAFTLKALWVAACPDEGARFFDWIAGSVGDVRTGQVPIMLGVGGERDLTAHELDHLAGHMDSRPVRVGNDAWRQKQLDVLGEVLECAWVLRDQLEDLSPAATQLLVRLADRAAESWREPDAGIWEGREGNRDYITSKLMCWVALDRAVKLADRLGSQDRVEEWQKARDQIRDAILDEGWNESINAFAGALGSDHLDAGVLLLPIVGFLPGDDDRVVATLRAVEEQLATGALVQRWTGAGDEGAFVICSYWLAQGWAMVGEPARAREIFEATTAHASDLGLLSEEISLDDHQLLGNYPQGLSHIGLINAAWAIHQAERQDNDS